MATTSVVCPQCQKRFTLKAENLSAMAAKQFRCPKCGYQTQFGRIMRPAPGAPGRSPKTEVVGGAHNAGPMTPPPSLKTRFGGGPSAPQAPGGKTMVGTVTNLVTLVVDEIGQSFSLPQGSFTLGRASSDSQATVKIAPDPYMSRLHARLDISGQGNAICTITPMSSSNRVYINNVPLDAGKTLPLKNNDQILLGMTKITVRF